jgi:hypothetical protein
MALFRKSGSWQIRNALRVSTAARAAFFSLPRFHRLLWDDDSISFRFKLTAVDVDSNSM